MGSDDPHRFIAGLVRDRARLELDTAALCFLARLHLHAEQRAITSYDDDQIIDLYVQVCDEVDPGAENPRKRATHAIQRLREQRMLARVDAAGIVRAGEYSLTGLAVAIVKHLLADEALTRESLTLLTSTLSGHLGETREAAKAATSPDDWRSKVVGPLRVTVADLVNGIERRKRGLDARQEEVQAEIGRLLHADWFKSIEGCQELLESTTTTLRELNDVLLRDTSLLQSLLQEIKGFAEAADQVEAADAAQRVIEQIDHIAAWGGARQDAWSAYYQRVHRYLQDVVRLDPNRALSQRLRDQLSAWSSRPFHLVGADGGRICLLRPFEFHVELPPVMRPRSERERPLLDEPSADEHAALEAKVLALLASGITDLATVTARVIESLPAAVRYRAAGQVAEVVAQVARAHSETERAWVLALDRLEIEQWTISVEERPS